MKLEFFQEFADPYLHKEGGQGVFLAGVVLGMVAGGQNKSNIREAPMFKQLNFGRLSRRDLQRHLARVPELTSAYQLNYAGLIEALGGKAGELMLKGGKKDIGIDGNFAFSVAFLNAPHYFWSAFRKDRGAPEEQSQAAEQESE
ncbi:MAG: TM1802 family CRISPR-associated protein [Synergistales bacterium]|nr:TM1802 family CRISPR-associated protein [Synergistales bacterium]